jgi:transposase
MLSKAPHRRIRRHFSFLFDPTLDATNWRAEHVLASRRRHRKMCGGGNRTRRGAQSQQVLASALRTADQRGLDASDLFVTRARRSCPPACA